MRTRSRLLQTCSSLKMMAMVRTSLQKVVVFLHRLQRMAISSPRYQKLCKVRGDTGLLEDREFTCMSLFLHYCYHYFLTFWTVLVHLGKVPSSGLVSHRLCLFFEISLWFVNHKLLMLIYLFPVLISLLLLNQELITDWSIFASSLFLYSSFGLFIHESFACQDSLFQL